MSHQNPIRTICMFSNLFSNLFRHSTSIETNGTKQYNTNVYFWNCFVTVCSKWALKFCSAAVSSMGLFQPVLWPYQLLPLCKLTRAPARQSCAIFVASTLKHSLLCSCSRCLFSKCVIASSVAFAAYVLNCVNRHFLCFHHLVIISKLHDKLSCFQNIWWFNLQIAR